MRYVPAAVLSERGLWRVRIMSAELERNRAMFNITPEEYQLAYSVVVDLLAKLDDADVLPDVKRIRQTNQAWRRFRLDDLRIVYEPKKERKPYTSQRMPVLIWHMLVRKSPADEDPDWIYDLVEQRQEKLYPTKRHDRKHRLIGA